MPAGKRKAASQSVNVDGDDEEEILAPAPKSARTAEKKSARTAGKMACVFPVCPDFRNNGRPTCKKHSRYWESLDYRFRKDKEDGGEGTEAWNTWKELQKDEASLGQDLLFLFKTKQLKLNTI